MQYTTINASPLWNTAEVREGKMNSLIVTFVVNVDDSYT